MHRQELVAISCPLCGSDNLAFFYEDSGMTFEKCMGCGLVFLNPRPPSQPFVKNRDVVEDQAREHLALSTWSLPRAKGFVRGADLISRHAQRGRLLDIGCGDGRFLSIMRERSGFDLYGLEPNAQEAMRASSFLGMDIFCGTLEEAGYEDGHFDVVTMWDVLEHVYDPVRELREVKRVLREGGLLLARVPNLSYFRLKQAAAGRYLTSRGITIYNPTHHLTYLNRDTALLLLESAGFEILAIRPSRSEYGVSDARSALKTGYHAMATTVHIMTCGRVVIAIDLLTLARSAPG